MQLQDIWCAFPTILYVTIYSMWDFFFYVSNIKCKPKCSSDQHLPHFMQFKSSSTLSLHSGCSFTVPLITHKIAWRSEAALLLPELSWLTSCSGYQISHNQRASFKLSSIAWKLYIIQFIYYMSPFMIHKHYDEIFPLLWLCLVLWGCVRLCPLSIQLLLSDVLKLHLVS